VLFESNTKRFVAHATLRKQASMFDDSLRVRTITVKSMEQILVRQANPWIRDNPS